MQNYKPGNIVISLKINAYKSIYFHPEGFYYHFTRCPLNDFARREGYLEVLPVMCEIDLLTASLMHAKLIRRQTLASGGDMCDYWFVGDKSPSAK